MIVNIAGVSAIGATWCLPRIGCWHMDAVVDSAEQLSGTVKIQVLNDPSQPPILEYSGTIAAGAPYTDTGYYRIVGGADGLRSSAKPRAYGQCQLRVPLKDILEGVGEQLDSSSDTAVTNLQLPGWTTLGVPAGRQIRALLQAAGRDVAWRFLAGGKLWVGRETWPDAGVSYEELGSLPQEHKIEIATDGPTLLPGTKLDDGRRVSYVQHSIDSGKLRTLVYLEAA